VSNEHDEHDHSDRDAVEHLDVLIVGAGLSGIGAACHLTTKCSWASFAIFEARDAIGGTWDLFRYPGVRSDSDMYTLGYSFRPWPDDRAIADGPSILKYIRDTAAEFGVDEKIRYEHRIVAAAWSSADARWHVTAERTDTGERVDVTCGFLFSCSGYYRYDHGYSPGFPDQDRFDGEIVHPQAWPEDLEYAGKKVVIIGSGATAITLAPAMSDAAAHVTMLQRSPSYVASMPATNPLANRARKLLGPRAGGFFNRWSLALATQGFYQVSQRRPERVKRIVRKGVEKQLPPGFDVDTHFTPSYNPWDQRFCIVPDGDLFRAISSGKLSIETDHIERFTDNGIMLKSGTELEADIIVTATGLELLFVGGIALTVDGAPVDVAERLTYKGMMLEGVPNLANVFGYTNASWTLKADLTCNYVCRVLNRMRAIGARQCTPVNNDVSMKTGPMLGLSSGYITRAIDRFPRSGTKFPWQVHQNYVRDFGALRLRKVDDRVLQFSNPS
jgi:cation diffusion facilitator CzcD-associated flavoprotein CzcO